MAAMDDELLVMPIAALSIDCADPPGLARWWHRPLGGEVEIDDDGVASRVLHPASDRRPGAVTARAVS